ncbi:phage tail tape measure protein [Roseburia hominis]
MNNFILQLVAGLNKTKSKQQIKSDAKSLGDMKFVKLIGNLDMPKTRKAIKAQLKGLNNLTFNITPNVNTKGVQSATKQAINNAQRGANSNKIHLNFDTNKQQLINQIKILGRNNNKLFSDQNMTAKYNQLLNSASVAKSTGELKTLRGELSAFKTELVATNNAGRTWSSKALDSLRSYAKFFSGASMIYALSNQVRNAATEAKTLDDSLVNLQKVTNEIGDRDSLYKYFDKSLSKAQELNVKVGSLIDAVTEFKKLGWDLDDAELGAKWANILSNVGDVDIDTAIGSIKTSIASFDEIGGYGNDQMDKKLEAYTDLINNMSNKYSIDAEGLAESIRLSAGTLTEAHMTIEQAATMFATANKYYNDPSYLGNTAKIGSLRMRASSGDTDAIEELQEMGEEVDDLATATSNLREKLMALTGVDIMEDEHTFKSYYDQLYEIAQVMDQLDDTSRANVLETMFGKSRSAAGAAILSGMKESASAYEDAINSAGSATEEYQTWMTSADAACQRFSNTLTQTYQSIINGNTVRDLANLGSAVLEFANNWGIVEGTLKGVIALNIGKFLATGTMALITATKQVEQYGKALQMASNVPNGNLSARFQTLRSIADATSSLTTEQLRNVLATKTLTQADRVRILQMQGMTKEMALQKLAEMNLTQATNAQTAANTASTASTFSLKAAMTGLGATLKSVFLSNPVGIVLMGISLGVSAVTSAVSKHNQAVEEARQKAKEAADAANTLGDEIADLANKYIQLSDAVKTDASAKEDLMTTQTELLKKLGLEGESIDDLIAKYGSLSNAIKQASIDSLKDQQIDLIAGVDAAREELIKAGKDAFGSDSWKKSIVAMGEEAGKAWQVLEDAGIISSGTHTDVGGEWFLSGDASEQGVLKNYKTIEKALEALRDSNKFTQEELSQNDLFKELYDRYNTVKEAAESYDSEIDNLNENLAQQTMLTALQGNELPKTEEDFNKFKQELIDTAVASKQFIGNEKEITDAINNYLSTVPEFEGYYSIPLENELDKVDELLNQEGFSKTSTDILTQVQALSDGLDQLDKIYADVYNKEDFDWSSILNNDGFKEAFGNMTNVTEEYKNAYDDFIKTISNNPSDLSACQSAFDNLATAYIQNKGALDNLTDSEKQAAITMLEQMGIANAEEVVMASLVQKKLESTDASADLVIGTAEEINALIAEGTVSEETAKKIAAYTLHKQLCNGNTINTAADCENIIRLAQVAGAGTEALIKLEALKQRLADSPVMADEMRTNINNKIKDILSGVQSSATVSLKVPQAKYSGGTSTKSAIDKANKSSGSSSKDSKETKETFNWVETAISRIQRAVTNLGKTVSATYKSWSTRNSALSSEMSAVTQEISVQQSAYQTYMDKANSVGLSDYYKNLVQNGGMSIEDVTDDTLKEQIQTYKEYYEKALAASDAVQDLRDNLAELAKTKFDNLAKKFENELDLIEHKSSMLDKYIDQTEKKGEIVSEHFYTTLIQNEQANVDKLQNEYNSLFNQLQDSISTGGIEVYSDDWYEMVGQINDVEEALVDANSALVDYEKSLLKLRWDNFDYLRDCISDIISETEFLADLLDNKKLFDDSGHLNNYGESLGALYAIEYNTYMNQADEYAKAIDELNKAITANPNDKDLLDRRQELYDAQREAIKNAESEKNAIKDLISDAYDAQLEALQKLIDKRKELLDATSDLYEYENTISEKTDTIASYQKQLQAYQGDNSEEGIANRQKIQTELEKAQKDLQQTEYEKWKSDQTAMLDDLYSEYETMLNSRLDDIDALVQDVINQSNANSVEIQGTIIDVANQVGYNVSNDLQTILDTNNGMYDMVAFYNENFTGLLTTTNMSINGVTDRINAMISYSDSNAVNIINSINTAANNIVTASLQAASVYSSTIASLQSQLTLATIAASNNSSNHSGGSSGSSRSGGSSSSLKPGKTGGTIKKPNRTMTGNNGSHMNHGWNIATRYAKGGNVSSKTKSPFDDLAQSMGEDTMVAVKEGERILTPVQNEMWEQWTSSLPQLIDLSDNIKIPDFSKTARNASQSNISIGIDNIQMNGVNNPEEFTKQLVQSVQQNGKVQSVLKDLTSNALLGKNSLRINKY